MKDYSLKNDFLGELIGSYILVLFGTGAVAAAVLYDAHQSLFQIGMLWAFAVTFGIYMTRNLSNAHFNPAVTVAMVLTGRMSAKRLPTYILGQFIGAFLGGLTVYGVYGSSIAQYEAKKNIVRGTFESVTTAKMFGEYYNQPGGYSLSMPLAIAVEALGTFLLVLIIFLFTEGANVGRPNDNTAPIFLTVNARVEVHPDNLTKIIKEEIDRIFKEVGYKEEKLNALIPGRPNPTFRYREIVKL